MTDIERSHLNECCYEHPFKLDINDLLCLNTYPNPSDEIHRKLKNNIANYVNVKQDNITITAGADDSISLIINSISLYRNTIYKYSPSYRFIENLNHIVHYVETPLKDRHRAMEFYKPEKNSIIYICNPCNPTNDLWDDTEFIKVCERYPECYVIVDEAYMDFHNMERNYKCVDTYKNLFFVRTFSKLFGIAGLRLGYFVHNKNFKVNNYCFKKVTNVAKLFGNKIFENLDFYKNIKKQIDTVKKYIEIDSPTNFVLIHPKEDELEEVRKYTEENNIAVRFGYGNAVRISFHINSDVKLIKDIIDRFDTLPDIRELYSPIDLRIKLMILFRKFYEVAVRNEMLWWADSGTLIGACRHNAIVPWDDDIDVAILEEDMENYKDILSGYFNIKKNVTTGLYYQICEKEFEGHPRDTEHIDIFPFYEENGTYLHVDERFRYDVSGKANFAFKEKELFPLKQHLFYDLYIPIPNAGLPQKFNTLEVHRNCEIVYKSSKLVMS